MAVLYASFFLLLLALLLIFLSGQQRRTSGLPAGRVVYTVRGRGQVMNRLRSRVTGKPDYLVERDGEFIPVEVKTGLTPRQPYASHVFQLAAYCLLVDRKYGKRPSHGILHYPAGDFSVEFTPLLESSLLGHLAEIRAQEFQSNVWRSHEDARRCLGCGFRPICDQRLG
jgi:CRISPR-associated exonuclease Cas4